MQKRENRFHVLLPGGFPVWLVFLFVMGFLVMGSSYQDDEVDPPDKRGERSLEAGQRPAPDITEGAIPEGENLAADDSEGWSQVGGRRVKINDELDRKGRVFADDSNQNLLLVPSEGERVFLLDLDRKQVSVLSRTLLLWDKLERPLLDTSDFLFIGPLVEDEGYLRFDYGNRTYAIQPMPPIVGEQSIDKIYELLPEYAHDASDYHPNKEALKALHNLTQDSKFLIFFGSWSHLSRHWIPRLMKTLELANNPHLLVTYYGVSQDLDEPQLELESYRVTAIPTVVIVRQNEELGRIEELPKHSIEEEVARILGVLPEASE